MSSGTDATDDGGRPEVLDGKVVLLPDLAAPAAARSAIRAALVAAGVDPASVEAALLLTSELVSNAVEHAGTELCVEIRIADDIRISVSDRSDLEPVMRAHGTLTERGRGLLLVDEIAESWGIERQDDGKTVFFHLRLPSRLAETKPAPAPARPQGASPAVEVDPVRFELAGELDAATADAARARFIDAVARRPGSPVVVDLADLSFCDSTGLGVLLFYRHTLQEAGRPLRLQGLQGGVRRIIEATGMTRLFTIDP